MITPILETRGLTYSYGNTPVLRSLDLSFEKEKITAVIGPNGCGKTTLLRCLCGILHPQSGEILLNGTSLHTLPGKKRAQHISFLPQLRPVPEITAEMLISHGRFPHLGLSRRMTENDRLIVMRAMETAGVTEFARRPLSALSGGERQRVYLAMVLAQDADIVLLDEPTTYLDARHKFETAAMMKKIKESGKTVIAVLHDLPLALSCSDAVVLLENGDCAACGTPEELYRHGDIDRVFGIRLYGTEAEGRRIYAELPAT